MSGSALAFDVGHDGVDGVEVLGDGVVVLDGEAEGLLDEHDELERPHGVDDVGALEGDVVLERVRRAASQEALQDHRADLLTGLGFAHCRFLWEPGAYQKRVAGIRSRATVTAPPSLRSSM